MKPSGKLPDLRGRPPAQPRAVACRRERSVALQCRCPRVVAGTAVDLAAYVHHNRAAIRTFLQFAEIGAAIDRSHSGQQELHILRRSLRVPSPDRARSRQDFPFAQFQEIAAVACICRMNGFVGHVEAQRAQPQQNQSQKHGVVRASRPERGEQLR